jgi:hypothetical protein
MAKTLIQRGIVMRKTFGSFSSMRRIFKKTGIGTVEVVILIAVLVGIALIFREQLTEYAHRIMEVVFDDNSVIDSLT